MSVALQVMKDWRVIVTIVAMLLVITLTKKLMNYKKRPKRIKKNKNGKSPAPVSTPAPKPQPQEEAAEPEEE